MQDVQAVAGSSAGAMAATLCALGVDPTAFDAIIQNTNMKALLGKGIINKDGNPLYELVNKVISDNISEFLKENNDIEPLCNQLILSVQKEIEDLPLIDKTNKELLNDVEQRKSILISRQQNLQSILDNPEKITELETRCADNKILFKDLDLLRAINPDKFKNLLITGTSIESGKLEIFNAENTPNVEIALAVRASASLPIMLKPVEIDGKKYIDGGVANNIPINHFNQERDFSAAEDITNNREKIAQATRDGRTLAFAFGGAESSSTPNIAIYSAKEHITSPNAIVKFLTDIVMKFLMKIGGTDKYSDMEEKTYQDLRNNALGTVALDTGSVGTISFKKAQEQVDYLSVKSGQQTAEYLHNHDLAKNIDRNLEHKALMLNIYEQSLSSANSWRAKTSIPKNQLVELLDFCKEAKWKNAEPAMIVEQYIKLAATDAKYKLNADTKAVKILTTILNDPKTPNQVKADFAKALNIDMTQNITSVKFQKKDFQTFVNKNQSKVSEKHNLQSVTGRHR
jgi:NTE family protein